MFKWLKNLFKESEDEFQIRVGNGPKQEGTKSGEGYGWSGHIPMETVNDLTRSTEHLKQTTKELEEALHPKTSSEPIVWAPVGKTISPKPATDITPEDKRTEWNKSASFVTSGVGVVAEEDIVKPKKTRKPKKLNKGLASKAKKAKAKAPKRKK